MNSWAYISKLKRTLVFKNVKKQLIIKNFNIQNYQSIDYWNNETNNINNINIIQNAFKVLSNYEDSFYNQIIIQTNNNTISVFLKNIKTLELQQYEEEGEEEDVHVQLKELELKIFLIKTIVPIITFLNYKNFKLILYQEYSAEPNLDLKTAFQKDQFSYYFPLTIQTFENLFFNNASAEILAQLVCICVRNNSQRIKFLAFLKRIIEWYFYQQSNNTILGIRIEIKGRFIAKSRAAKQILTVGNIKEKKISDYKHIVSFTKLGSLSIKVWLYSKTFI